MGVEEGIGRLKRQETINIRMELDKGACLAHTQALRDIPSQMPDMEENDLININYTLTANYLGDVTKALAAVREICADPRVVVSASCNELTEGKILFYEALKQLEAVIQEIKKR